MSEKPIEVLKEQWAYLTPSYREFIKYLVSIWRYCRKIFPSLLKIAERIGFSKSTVNRAKNYFIKIGILSVKKRAYLSNTYHLDADLLKVDFKNKKWHFTYEDEPIREPVSYVANTTKYVHNVLQHKVDKKEPPLAHMHDKFKHNDILTTFDFGKYGWIFKKLSLYLQQKVLENFTWYLNELRKKGETITKDRGVAILCSLLFKEYRKNRS